MQPVDCPLGPFNIGTTQMEERQKVLRMSKYSLCVRRICKPISCAMSSRKMSGSVRSKLRLQCWRAAMSCLSLLAVSVPRLAAAHGWLAVPAARNLLAVGQDDFYEQMSLNRCSHPF